MTTLDVVREELIQRRYNGPLEVGDGRTVVGLCAPYDTVATVADDAGAPYSEVIRKGAFRRQTRDPARILLTYEHREGLGDVVGPGIEFVERDDGLLGTFRVLPGPLGDQALELIRSGATTGLSVSAALHPQGTRIVDGVVERHLLTLRHVALTSSPAYAGAEVLAMRSGERHSASAAAFAKTAALRAKYDR